MQCDADALCVEAFDGIKPYARHFVLRVGVSDTKWPNDIGDKKGSYVASFLELLDEYKKSFSYSIRTTVTDLHTRIDDADVNIDDVQRCDIMLFPDALLFRALELSQVHTHTHAHRERERVELS